MEVSSKTRAPIYTPISSIWEKKALKSLAVKISLGMIRYWSSSGGTPARPLSSYMNSTCT